MKLRKVPFGLSGYRTSKHPTMAENNRGDSMKISSGMKMAICCFAGSLAALSLFCKNPVNQPPAELITVIQPAAGAHLKVNDIRTIEWRVSDYSVISSIGVMLSIDRGRTYSMLVDSALPVQTTSIIWTIASDQVSDSCIIKVYDYSDESVNGTSGMFSVVP
jgi:hypothetical protein